MWVLIVQTPGFLSHFLASFLPTLRLWSKSSCNGVNRQRFDTWKKQNLTFSSAHGTDVLGK